MTVLKGVGIALKGLGRALKKDPSTPINPVKPTKGLKQTEAYKKKIKSKQTKPPMARMEYTTGPYPGIKGGEKTILKKEQVIGEKKRK